MLLESNAAAHVRSVPQAAAQVWHTAERPLKCLWIGRYIPYPMDAGAKVYSARLAESLAAAGAMVRFTGFGDLSAVARDSRVDWRAVPNQPRGQLAALVSHLPVAAAVDSTQSYKALLEEQLHEDWDAIVLDGYAAGWALPRCIHYRAAREYRCAIVHVSHNHEAALWRSMALEARSSIPKRLVLWQNYLKVRTLERRIARSVDLLTAITDEDALALGGCLPHGRRLTLTPGYAGWVAPDDRISAAAPRRVIIVGSFRWVMKRENLARFVEVADPLFKRHNIVLDVVGDVAEELLAGLRKRCQAVQFHGFVDDVSQYLSQARIAVVPELIGGGFKLKFLDYIFARVPVATLAQAAAGIPAQLQQHMLLSGDLDELVNSIIVNIDKLDDLNRMQARAFACGEALFRWEDRGQQLHRAIAGLRQEFNAARPRSHRLADVSTSPS